MRSIFARLATAISVAAVLLVGAGPAQADAPTVERIQIEATFPEPLLSGACGVDVTVSISGSVTIRNFADAEQNLVQVATLNVSGTATSVFGTMRFRDVGGDRIMVMPDGTVTLSIIGQVPFDITGVLVLNLETGEVIKEAHFSGDRQIEKACRFLAP